MKKKLLALLNIFIILTLLLPIGSLAAGNMGVDAASNIYLPVVLNTFSGPPEPVIPETTKVLDDSTTQYLASISEDRTEFTFSQSTVVLDELDPGDVMVGDPSTAAPDGFLRKVTTVFSTGGQVVVQTEDATLEDAIQVGAVHKQMTLTPADVEETFLANGVRMIAPMNPALDDKFNIAIQDVVLYDDDGDENTEDDQIKANGNLVLEPGFDFDLVIRDWELDHLRFTNTTVETAEVEVSAELELASIKRETTLATYHFTPIIVWVGIVPVVFTPELEVKVGVDGSVHVGVTTSVTQQATLTAGLQYSDGRWSPVTDFSNEFTFIPPTLSAGLDLKGYAAAELSVNLYGVAGPYAAVQAYLKLEADLLSTPWWELYSGLEVLVGVDVEIMSHVVAGYESTVIDFKKLLAEAKTITFTEYIIDEFSGASSVFALDVNGDENIDILGTAKIPSNSVAWWNNDGNQSFSKNVIDSNFIGANSVYAIDMDNDDDIDVLGAAPNGNADEVAWWENNGSQIFTKHTISNTLHGPVDVYAIDIEGDSDVDVFSISAGGGPYGVSWWENDGAQNFTYHNLTGSYGGGNSVYVVDIDGDSDLDVLASSNTIGSIIWLENDGSQNFTQNAIEATIPSPISAYAVDIDSDNDVDILASFGGFYGKIGWWENDGSENFTRHAITDNTEIDIFSVYAVDVDGDYDVDILSASQSDGYKWWENNGNEYFIPHELKSITGAYSIYAIDVDGDEDIDVLGAGPGQLLWWEQLP